MGRGKPVTGACEISVGVDSEGPGIRVLLCFKPGVEHPVGRFGAILCPEHCAAMALSDRYVTPWGGGHCVGE